MCRVKAQGESLGGRLELAWVETRKDGGSCGFFFLSRPHAFLRRDMVPLPDAGLGGRTGGGLGDKRVVLGGPRRE